MPTTTKRTVPRPLYAAIFVLTLTCFSPSGIGKTPGKTYCFNQICHRVHSIEETKEAIGRVETVTASFYDAPDKDPYNPRLETSSGEIFRPDNADNVASPIWPDGTKLLLWHEASGLAAIVRVNNAGPYHSDRLIDLSRALAHKLGLAQQGVGSLRVVPIAAPTVEEARYQHGRSYPAVTGVLGRFASIHEAAGQLDNVTEARVAPRIAVIAEVPRVAGWSSIAVSHVKSPDRPAHDKPVVERRLTKTASKRSIVAAAGTSVDDQIRAQFRARGVLDW